MTSRSGSRRVQSGSLNAASDTRTCGLRDGCPDERPLEADASREPESEDREQRDGPPSSTPGVFDLVVTPFVPLPPIPAPAADKIAGKSGWLKEVDVVHVGGRDATTPPLFVSVAGTGSVGVLSSFRSESVGDAPKHLNDGPKLLGHNHQLRVLRADESVKSSYELVVSARLRDQSLWLNTWRVHPSGQLELLHGLGYGRSLSVAVEDYTLSCTAT